MASPVPPSAPPISDRHREIARAIVDHAFKDRTGHGGAERVVYRQLRPEELEVLLIVAMRFATGESTEELPS